MTKDTQKGVNTMTKYFFNRDGQPEEVELERWRWEAYYLDGSVLKQFNKLDEENGEFHQFKEIDQTKLNYFRMVSDDPGRVFTVLFNAELHKEGKMDLIHFYQKGMKVVETVNEKGEIIVTEYPLSDKNYCFGYSLNGKKTVNIITPSGDVILTDDPNRVYLEIPTKEAI